MNGNELLDIVGKIDPKLVQQTQKPPVIRWIALAACLALIIGITAMLLHPGASPTPSNPVLQAPTEPSPTVPSVPTSPITPSTLPSDPTEPSTPTDSTIPIRDFTVDPKKITGVQHLGNLSFPNNDPVEPPLFAFWIHLAVEVRVTDILPDLYLDPLTNYPYHILKLETLDVINGNNIPDFFYLRLPSYLSPELQHFDSLIISMNQVGIEDQILINTDQQIVESFSLLFETYNNYAPYFGSVVAFTDGIFDPGLFELKGWSDGSVKDYLEDILSGEPPKLLHDYPAKAGYTPADTKAHINNWIANRPNPLQYRNLTVYTRDSFAYDEVFDYIKTGVFAHARPNKPIYCRIINGFPTTEQITITVDSVTYSGEAFTQQDLQAMPDIGAFMEGLDLDTLAPPHINDTSNLELIACGARGMYAKANGQVYGLVKINWTYFDKDAYYNWAFYDGLYYLATTDGTIRPIEREELLALLGDNPGVQFSSYGYQAFIDSFEYGTCVVLPWE